MANLAIWQYRIILTSTFLKRRKNRKKRETVETIPLKDFRDSTQAAEYIISLLHNLQTFKRVLSSK